MTYDYRQAQTVDIDTLLAYNLQLAKLLQRLKRDAGAQTVAANYKGTGSQRYRRQLFVRFKSGAFIDLWLEANRLEFGGVVDRGKGGLLPRAILYNGRTPEEVYKEAAGLLSAWATV